MRKEYQMSAEDLETLKEACKPVPYICVGGGGGVPLRTPLENAIAAWCIIGNKMGFDPATPMPIHGKGMDWFTAEPVPGFVEELKPNQLSAQGIPDGDVLRFQLLGGKVEVLVIQQVSTRRFCSAALVVMYPDNPVQTRQYSGHVNGSDVNAMKHWIAAQLNELGKGAVISLVDMEWRA